MKLTLLSLLASAVTCFASVVTTFNNSSVTSSVVSNKNGLFTYTYNISPYKFTKKDISYFEIEFCDDVEIINPTSNIRFEEEYEDDSYKFDSLENDNNSTDLWFKFDSPNAPEMGDVIVKYGNTESYANVNVPSCIAVPEASTLSFAILGTMLLLRRRR